MESVPSAWSQLGFARCVTSSSEYLKNYTPYFEGSEIMFVLSCQRSFIIVYHKPDILVLFINMDQLKSQHG